MQICKSCGNPIPARTWINDKSHVTNKRRFCLTCRPFKYREADTPERKIENRRERRMQQSRNWYIKKKNSIGEDPITAMGRARKRFLLKLIGSKCQLCGYAKTSRNLVFHHLNETEKLFTLSIRQLQRSSLSIFQEALKCMIACHNCHGEIHEGIIKKEYVKEVSCIFTNQLMRYRTEFLSLNPRGEMDNATLS